MAGNGQSGRDQGDQEEAHTLWLRSTHGAAVRLCCDMGSGLQKDCIQRQRNQHRILGHLCIALSQSTQTWAPSQRCTTGLCCVCAAKWPQAA